MLPSTPVTPIICICIADAMLEETIEEVKHELSEVYIDAPPGYTGKAVMDEA
jgi:hypothetical protein